MSTIYFLVLDQGAKGKAVTVAGVTPKGDCAAEAIRDFKKLAEDRGCWLTEIHPDAAKLLIARLTGVEVIKASTSKAKAVDLLMAGD